ncbi:MAG TPA: TolC family protein, partial [Stenomitos sp.]
MKQFVVLSLAATLWVAALPAAQAAPAPLTLAETLQLAREKGLASQASAQRVASAQALQEAAGAPLMPSVGLQVAPGLSSGRTPSGGGQATPAGVAMDTTLSANQLVYDWGAAGGNRAIAENQTRIAQLTLDQTQQDTMATAAVGYFQVLRSEALAKVQENAVQQAQTHLRLAQLRLKAGTGTRAESLQLQAQLANAQTALSQARNAVAIARLSLGNTLNTPIGSRPLVASVSVPAHAVAEPDVAQRLATRPEVQAQTLRADSDEKRAAVERTS